jgi:hypothetical protein
MVAVVFEATITSQVPPTSYTVSESGHVLQNVEVSKRFAKQIKQVIVEKIGQNSPPINPLSLPPAGRGFCLVETANR